MDEHGHGRIVACVRRKQVKGFARRLAVTQAKFGAAGFQPLDAIVLGFARPAQENFRVFRNPRSVVVFGLVIQVGHHSLPRHHHEIAVSAPREQAASASTTGGNVARHQLMKVDGKPMRTIWLEPDGRSVGIIDQTALPHRFVTARLTTLDQAAHAIRAMLVRGAPLIGAAAAYGVCLAVRADTSDDALDRARATLIATRPTAINLKWALDEMMAAVRDRPRAERITAAYRRAAEICDEDVAINSAIGRNGLPLIEAIAARKKAGERVNVLTHCNAGWLATVDCRHGDGADLSGARPGHRHPCLCR